MRIGLIGYGGAVGRYAAEKLQKLGYDVVGAQRREADFLRGKIAYVPLDISKKEQLERFCESCDVVINCASPSYLYGSMVAECTRKCKKIYFEPTDYVLRDDRLSKEGIYVSSCGYVPGISEYVPRILAKTEFDNVEVLTVFQGGNAICSPSAFADLVLSAGASGSGDTYLKEGKLRPLHFSVKEKATLDFMKEKVILKPFISDDYVELQKELQISEMSWFNTYENMDMIRLFMRCVRYSADENRGHAADEIKEIVKRYCEEQTEEDIHHNLVIEMTGQKDGRQKAIRIQFLLRDASRFCGRVLAEIVHQTLQSGTQISAGRYYGYRFLRNDYIERISMELEEGESLKIEEVSVGEVWRNHERDRI